MGQPKPQAPFANSGAPCKAPGHKGLPTQVGKRNRQRAPARSVGVRFLKPELQTHHEVYQGLGLTLERFEHRLAFLPFDPVLLEDLINLFFFIPRALYNFTLLADALTGVVLCIPLSGEEASEPHGNRSGGDLGQPGEHHQMRRADRARESGRKGKGNRQAVGHANHDIAD